MAESQSFVVSSSKSLHRCHSMDNIESASNFEGYIFFDPMNFSQCMPARSNKIEFIEKTLAVPAKKNSRGKNKEKGSDQGKKLPAKPQTPQGDESNGSEISVPAESNSTEKTEVPLKQAVAEESLQGNPNPKAQNITGGLCLGGEKSSASEAESNTGLNAVDETENVEQVENASSEDSVTENDCKPMEIPPFEWNYFDEPSLKKIVQIQEDRLEREKQTTEFLKKTLGSCQEENFQLKNEILAVQTAMTQREYAIEQMKMVIDGLSRDRDDVLSERSVNHLRIKHKFGYLVSEIRKLEKREVMIRALLKEACNEDEKAFENAMKVVDQNADLRESLEELKETLSGRENAIVCLKNKLMDAMKKISGRPETGAGNETALKERNEFLENTLKKTKMERDGLRNEYQSSLNEWRNIHQLMEKENQECCDTMREVKTVKESLEIELSNTKKHMQQKSGDIEKYEELMVRRESELFESKKALNNFKLETQRSLNEMEDEMQEIRKQNEESYDLLGIATGDLKILRKRNRELEETCNEKDLQREGSARALNELKLSDENLKMENTQLEKKYSEVLLEIGELTQRSDKVTRINAELEDSISMMSEKNEMVILDNQRLYDELEVGIVKLKDSSKELEESKKEKAELEEIAQNLREEKRALSVEVDELKVDLQLTQHENHAEKFVEGAESHEDILKSEVEKLNEEMRRKDRELLNYKQAAEAREVNKGNEMARNYEQLNSELQQIINELDDCRVEGLKDTQSYGDKIKLLEADKSKLSVQLKDGKKTEKTLRNMIQELQDDLLEQEERFSENSILIFQETEDARKRIANVEQHFNGQLAAKDTEIESLQEIGNNLVEKLRELEQVVCELKKREVVVTKDNILLKRKKKSLDMKLEKAKRAEKCLNKKLELSEDKLNSLKDLQTAESGVNAEVENKTLNKLIEDMTRDLEQARKENLNMKNQVEIQGNNIQKKAEKYNGMKQTIDSLKIFSAEQTEKCNELIKDLAFEKEKQTALEDKTDSYYKKMNELNDQLRARERHCSDFKRRYEDAEKLCNELQQKLKDVQIECVSLTKIIGGKESLQEKTRSELLKLRVEYDNCQKQLEEKESEKGSLQCQLKSIVANQNNELIMEVRKSHTNVMEALHESKMGEMRNELIEMKRKGVLRREMAMSAMEKNSSTTIRCS